MVCKYTLELEKGSIHEFKNEAALTQALLTKYELFNEFGDIVFNQSARKTSTTKKINKAIEDGQKAQQYIDKYYSKQGNKVEYNEDGQVVAMEKPAMGVNKFISIYTHIVNGIEKHIQPEFREESYWNKKKEEWLKGNFDEQDKELIKEIEGDNFNFEDKSLVTDSSINAWRKAIQSKWDAQGKTGTALHAVSEKFFSKDSSGKYNFELLKENPSLISEWYKEFAKDQDKYKQVTYGDFVTEEQFTKMLEMCSKLKSQIEEEYGEGCDFYPELTISTKITEERDGCDTIIGIIDLLVIDRQGRTHIYDYKTSTKPYGKYHATKKSGFTYQLAVYDRILQHYGIYTGDGSCKIVPIQLVNFRLQGDKYVYDDIAFNIQNDTEKKVDVKDLSMEIKLNQKMITTINEFLPPDVHLEPTSEKLLERVQEVERKWTPKYNIQRNSTDQEIDDMIRAAGGYTPNKLGQLEFKFKTGFGAPITVDATEPNAEAKLHQLVKEEIQSWAGRKRNMAEAMAEQVRYAIQHPGSRFTFERTQTIKGNSQWLTQMMEPYCNGDYEVVTEPAALCLGMLFFKNVHNGNMTVMKLTGAQLDRLVDFGKGRTNMNGKYSSDIEEDSKGDSLMLKSYVGNIEAIEAMVALQNIDFGYDLKVSEIKVVNPYMQREMPVSNKELLYTYKNLMEHENLLEEGEEDKFKNGRYALLTETAKLQEKFIHIMKDDSYSGFEDFSREILPEIMGIVQPPTGEQTINWNDYSDRDKLLTKLNGLRIKLENTFSNQVRSVRTDLQEINQPEYQLYYQVMMAIAELKGVNSRQQVKDADNWLQNGNFAKILSEGWEGLMLENPGNFKSPMLNQLTKSVSNVFQKIKDRLNRKNRDLRRLMENLKKEANYGWVSNNISGNETELFKDMTYMNNEGDFLFVNPNTLTGAKKQFLEFALESINKDRYFGESEETLDEWKEKNDVRYYRVPLMKASTASRRSAEGLVSTAWDRLKTWRPANALKDAREKLEGFFFEEDEDIERTKVDLYEMGTKFDIGEHERRLELIKREGGENAFEHNIETILLHHAYAYALKQEMNAEMPIMKATAMCLAMQGAGANPPEKNFHHLIDFVENYIKYAVKNQNIAKHPLGKEGSEWLGKLKMATSVLALGLSPLQFTYQTIEGIWKACALIWKKPDGTEAFTCKNMWEAFKSAYQDLAYYKDRPSKGMQINEMYGINDMDSNQFADRISSDKSIWTHFTDFMFRFASRPDYYNRMTIFGAQMRKDGTWDAHTLDREGNLIYNWKLDERYKAYATNDKSDMVKYNEAKAKYLAALQQFQKEGVTNDDGTALKIGDALPRAYTNQEAQAMKAVADNMYGYYNHETKSMLSATTMGALAMQMKTYWSAKKNQYLAPGGCKLMGHWEDYMEPKKDENGNIITDANKKPIMEQLYYAAGANGEIDLSQGYVTAKDSRCSKIKVKKWKGQYQEGIISTLMRFGKTVRDSEQEGFGGFKEAIQEMWYNTDDNLRTAYRSNIKHLIFDLVFMFGIGNLVALICAPEDDELRKAHYADKANLDKAMYYASYNFMYKTLRNSFMDFNFIDSIFSPVVDWQPMSFSSITKLSGNIWDYITTDNSFASTLANSSAVTRQLKPVIRSLTYDD